MDRYKMRMREIGRFGKTICIQHTEFDYAFDDIKLVIYEDKTNWFDNEKTRKVQIIKLKAEVNYK